MIFSLKDGKHLYQWDRERVLLVSDPTINQVHFTNDTVTQAIKKDVCELDGQLVVDIPAVLLQHACILTAYAFVAENEDREYTLVHEEFRVLARKRPDDYIPPDEYDKWEDVRKEILEALEQAQAAASDAATSEQNAATSEQNAAASEEATEKTKEEVSAMLEQARQAATAADASAAAAKTSETNADASEAAAKESENNAKTSEQNALKSENNASGYKNLAEQAATNAANSAAEAKNYEIGAAGSATAASNSAREAKIYESNAGALADTAAEKVTEAAGKVAEAEAKAAEAATSASEAKISETNAANSEAAAKAAQAAAEAARDEAADIAGGDFASNTALKAHTENTTVHITTEERTAWNSKAEGEHTHSQYLTQHQDISGKANVSDLTEHTGNGTVHITAAERTAWNNKSNFSGNYNDLTNKPTIPTVPVQSVNGKTGAVSLCAGDVGALPTSGGTMTGAITLPNNTALKSKDSSGTAQEVMRANGSNQIIIGANGVWDLLVLYHAMAPATSAVNTLDIGVADRRWRNLYMSGFLSDGTNKITVANIASKSDITAAIGSAIGGSY